MPRYIDAQKLKDAMNIEDDTNGNFNIMTALKLVDEAPTADVQDVMHGHWIKMKNFCLIPTYECSLCGRQIQTLGNARKNSPYCHCGAKMDGEEA